MQFFNVGTDIEKVSRFKHISKRLLEKIFSKNELNLLKDYSIIKSQHIAGIFSAKEAVIKSCNPFVKLNFQDIEIHHNKDGSPYALLIKKSRISSKNLKVSISHSGNYAVAVAVLTR